MASGQSDDQRAWVIYNLFLQDYFVCIFIFSCQLTWCKSKLNLRNASNLLRKAGVKIWQSWHQDLTVVQWLGDGAFTIARADDEAPSGNFVRREQIDFCIGTLRKPMQQASNLSVHSISALNLTLKNDFCKEINPKNVGSCVWSAIFEMKCEPFQNSTNFHRL